MADATTLNVETSLQAFVSAHFTNALASRPSWMLEWVVLQNWPAGKISYLPAISLWFNTLLNASEWQGSESSRSTGAMYVALWVSRNSRDWVAQLRYLRSITNTLFTRNGQVQVSDYEADPAAPVLLERKVDILSLDWRDTAADGPNPDLMRASATIRYSWTERT